MNAPAGEPWSWPSDDPSAPGEPVPTAAEDGVDEEAELAGLRGAFEVLGRLGRGGMGVVYKARDGTGRQLAVKVCRSSLASERQLKRFEREGVVTAALNHPGIVRIHSTGMSNGAPYLAYELVEGCRTLEEAMPDLDRRQRLELIRDVARALGYAHGRGVVHRDVKPENILLDREGRVRVADFGLALARGADRLTATGALLGTPLFMAPEQASARRDDVGPPTDVWALGVLLYQATTGLLPFEADSFPELTLAIERAQVPSLRGIDSTISSDLEAVCLKALSRRPAERYADGEELALDLDRLLAGEPVGARGVRLRRTLRRLSQSAALVGAGLLTVLLLALAGNALRHTGPSREARIQDLDAEAWSLLSSGGSVLAARTSVAELTKRARELELGPSARAARRATTLEGLLCLADGRASDAGGALMRMGSEPSAERSALSGAIAAVTTGSDPRTATSELSRAIVRGVTLAELRGWRAQAQTRAGFATAVQAEATLADLDALAQVRAAGAVEHECRARALLALGRFDGLVQVMSHTGGQPLRLLADAVDRACRDRQPAAAARLLSTRASDLGFPEAKREALVRVAVEEIATQLRQFMKDGGPLEQTLEWVQLLLLLKPRTPPSKEFIRALIYAAFACNQGLPKLRLTLAAAELVPADYEVQRRAAFLSAEAIPDGEDVPRSDAALHRAIALAPDESARMEVSCVRCWFLLALKRYDECDELCSQLLPRTQKVDRRLELSAARSMARLGLGKLDEALADTEAGLALIEQSEQPPSWAIIMRARMHLTRALSLERLGRERKAAEEAARYADVQGAVPGPIRRLEEIIALLWEHGRRDGTDPTLNKAVLRLIDQQPAWSGWRVRLAWLQLQARSVGPCLESLEQAAQTAPSPVGLPLGLLSELAGVRESIQERGGRAALPELKALVEKLDTLRGTGSVP